MLLLIQHETAEGQVRWDAVKSVTGIRGRTVHLAVWVERMLPLSDAANEADMALEMACRTRNGRVVTLESLLRDSKAAKRFAQQQRTRSFRDDD